GFSICQGLLWLCAPSPGDRPEDSRRCAAVARVQGTTPGGEPVPHEDPRRRIPRTDQLLADPRLTEAGRGLGRDGILAALRGAQERARTGLIAPEDVLDAATDALPAVRTKLGRAPLSDSAIAAVGRAAAYTDLEYDVHTGRRGPRGAGVVGALRDRLPEGTDAMVVNNGAAALLLAVTALAGQGDEVVV